MIPNPANPQAFNRYSYVVNQPINLSDPSGHCYLNGLWIPNGSGGQCPWQPNTTGNNGGGSGGNGDGNEPNIPEFENLPIAEEEIDGVQWFGGTTNAYELYAADDEVYQYCHYFHCGLDILANWGTPVTAGLYGEVLYAGCDAGNHEGPCKVQIKVGEYVITYGHLNGTPLVVAGSFTNPNTVLGGVGTNSRDPNNPNFPNPNANFPHIHLEVRGPGGWAGGPSVNPMLFIGDANIVALVEIATSQSVEPQMATFSDGTSTYLYPPPSSLMPNQIWRTTQDDPFFPR